MIEVNVRNTYEYCGDGCCMTPLTTYIDIVVDDILVHEEETHWPLLDEQNVIDHFEGRDDLHDIVKKSTITIDN